MTEKARYLMYSTDRDGNFVFWQSGFGWSELEKATLYDEPGIINGGSCLRVANPSTAALQLEIARILRENYDTNFASQAGSQHVAGLIASKLAGRYLGLEMTTGKIDRYSLGAIADLNTHMWQVIEAAIHQIYESGYAIVLPTVKSDGDD